MNWLERKLLEMEIKKMLNKMSYRTTLFGIVGIVGTIASAIWHFHTTGQFDLDGTLKSVVAIATGAGLIAAADHKNLPGGGAAPVLLIACLLFCFSAQPAVAQSPANIYAAGISANNQGTPGIAGTALYARLVNDGSGTYAFTVVDALPTNFKPFVVTTNISAGVAQKLFSIGKIPIFVPTSAGVSFNGTNTGWAWSTGALASVKLKGNWRIFPTVRIAKSSVSNGTGYQPIFGILFGYAN